MRQAKTGSKQIKKVSIIFEVWTGKYIKSKMCQASKKLPLQYVEEIFKIIMSKFWTMQLWYCPYGSLSN